MLLGWIVRPEIFSDIDNILKTYVKTRCACACDADKCSETWRLVHFTLVSAERFCHDGDTISTKYSTPGLSNKINTSNCAYAFLSYIYTNPPTDLLPRLTKTKETHFKEEARHQSRRPRYPRAPQDHCFRTRKKNWPLAPSCLRIRSMRPFISR